MGRADRVERLVIFLLLGIPMVISAVLLLVARPEQWWGALSNGGARWPSGCSELAVPWWLSPTIRSKDGSHGEREF